jgi:hypothetical protein
MANFQVILAFWLSATLSLVTSILYLSLQIQTKESQNPVDKGIRDGIAWLIQGSTQYLFPLIRSTQSRNPNDQGLRRNSSWSFQHSLHRARLQFWAECTQKIALSVSDQQLVTGMAILIVAYVKLVLWNNISVYHFSIVMDLAWFSSNTHIFSLLVLREYLRGSEDQQPAHQRASNRIGLLGDEGIPWMRIFRALFMCIIAAGLLVGTIMGGYKWWGDAFHCQLNYAIQDLPGNFGGTYEIWMVVDLILILSSYPRALCPLFRTSTRAWDWLYNLVAAADKSAKNRLSKYHITLSTIYSGLSKLALWILVFWESLAWAITEQIFWYGIGIWSLWSDLQQGRPGLADKSENLWGFGQLLPLMLLILPGLTAWEVYDGKCPKSLVIHSPTKSADREFEFD